MGLRGWVINSSQGVFIEVEGQEENLHRFLGRVEGEKPPRSFIQSLESSFLDAVGFDRFEVRESQESGVKTVIILPDIATCPDCLSEIFDPQNRRFRYPFTNCTNCGPRFTIVEALPYDRINTTMRDFRMCPECQAEYDDPGNRRFHAQPNACPKCGPWLDLWDPTGEYLATHDDALRGAALAIAEGRIVAVKGLGGFHLMVDARNESAVARLRERKHREEKPLALMYPSMDSIRADAEVTELEERLLDSPESPILLVRRRRGQTEITGAVAPENPYLGLMLPYTPLHHLLMAELGFPVVATSGNLSDEPIVIDERDALERLGLIADLFLVHNRPIARHADDSIVRVVMGREMLMRRARGYAPLPIPVKVAASSVLAVGPHLKNTVALSVETQVFVSQHLGDLETAHSLECFRRTISDFRNLYEIKPETLACDLHPDYLSSHFAEETGESLVKVQHHYAHVLSVMAENEVEGPVLGVCWDGTGYGTDGTVWGGEFLVPRGTTFDRVAHLRTFRLPGGERAVKEPRRSAMGLLHEILGDGVLSMRDLPPIRAFSQDEQKTIVSMLEKNVNCPVTSSAGRLFDAVASITDVCQRMRFEGQGGMQLEFALEGVDTDTHYPLEILDSGSVLVVDWEASIRAIMDEVLRKVPASQISARFHNTLVEMMIEVARQVGEEKVALTGGCFQNRYLTERAIRRLREEGFRPYWHQRVPPNDGGISLGQVVAVLRQGDTATR
jgi:hydrogenase maturation protein HypF